VEPGERERPERDPVSGEGCVGADGVHDRYEARGGDRRRQGGGHAGSDGWREGSGKPLARQPCRLQRSRAQHQRRGRVTSVDGRGAALDSSQPEGGQCATSSGDAGGERGRLGETYRKCLRETGVLASAVGRPQVCQQERTAARDLSERHSRRAAQPLLDRAPEQKARGRRGKRREGELERAPLVERPHRSGDLASQHDREPRGCAGVERDLERLPVPWVEPLVGPTEQCRQEEDVAGARDREKLRGALQEAQQRCVGSG
jgi:hypothetical protein